MRASVYGVRARCVWSFARSYDNSLLSITCVAVEKKLFSGELLLA